MSPIAIPTYRLDRMAIGLSGICLVHCLATSVLLALVASAGERLTFGWDRNRELMTGWYALGLGVMAGALTLPHNGTEALYTVVVVGILALGHRLNFIASE